MTDERRCEAAVDLTALTERYRDRLVSRARRILNDAAEAEDVAQEALLRACRADLPEPGAVAGWLVRTAQRLALDRLRERVLRAAATDRAVRDAPRGTGARDDASADLRAAVRRLEEPYRSAVTLRYLDGRGFAEIAKELGTIERTARTWTGRGLQKLRDRLAR